MQIGTIVKSRAGRDKDRWFVVVGVDADFALIVDGKERSLSKPKKKRKKHLAVTRTILDPATYQSDRALRKAVLKFGESVVEEGLDLGKR